MQRPPVWLGIDLGTQSVRVLAVDADGQVAGRGAAPLTGRRDGRRHEQDPDGWWDATGTAARAALRDGRPVSGVAICSTSGTVLLTDRTGRPLTPGVMYDDARAAAESVEAQAAGAAVWHRLGHRIQPTWALAKAMWLARRHPGAYLAHQADFVARRLTGTRVATDSSHALKTGYDLLAEEWPVDVFAALRLPAAMFPKVVTPGTVIGVVGEAGAAHTGIPAGTPVVAGMTDGCAAQLGSGALRVGRWNSVLGTTLVLKGVTTAPVHDPSGVMYSHRSPDGRWLPGGASSVGAGVLAAEFPDADLAELDARAARYEPAGTVIYPLVSQGERFPFAAPEATAFSLEPVTGDERYAALLQGVALVERLCLAYVRCLGAPVSGPVTLTGGAARSEYWCRLRAEVLGRPVRVPEHTEPALGMAVLAAYALDGGGRELADVAESMVRIRTVIEPSAAQRFAEPYGRLLDALEGRGWLPPAVAAYAREHD